MKLNVTKLAAAAAALVAGTALIATAAHAEPTVTGQQGPYALITDTSDEICAMGISGAGGKALIIGYTEEGGTATSITYVNPDIGDLTDTKIKVTLALDNDKYDWDAMGGDKSITLVSTDATVPQHLKDAKMFALEVDDQLLVVIKSDADFEAAMDQTVACAHALVK